MIWLIATAKPGPEFRAPSVHGMAPEKLAPWTWDELWKAARAPPSSKFTWAKTWVDCSVVPFELPATEMVMVSPTL